MRKFTIMGLGALSTLGLTIGTIGTMAPAAHALELPGVSLVQAVCTSVAGPVAGLVNQQAVAGQALAADQGKVASTVTARDLAVTDLVGSLVSYIGILNLGGNADAAAGILNAKSAVYGDKMANWSNAVNKTTADQSKVDALGIQSTVLNGLKTGLACL